MTKRPNHFLRWRLFDNWTDCRVEHMPQERGAAGSNVRAVKTLIHPFVGLVEAHAPTSKTKRWRLRASDD